MERNTSASGLCYINLLNGPINNPNQTTEALLGASKEVGLEVSAKKTGYVFMSLRLYISVNMLIFEAAP
jgi:hypothetical protein